MKKIGVLVVIYNSKSKILNWLKIYNKKFSKDPCLYLLILDNNSSDGSYQAVRHQFPGVDIRRLNDNYGCTTARNVGIIELICNVGCYIYASFDDDVIIEDEHFFSKMRKAFDNYPEVDGYCGILRWGDDRTICTMGSRNLGLGVYKSVKRITKNTKIDFMPGGACMVRATTFKKYGLYDNDFPPIGGQDKNWGIRVSSAGAILHYNPEVELFHYHDRNQYDSAQKHGYVIQGRIIHLRKIFSLASFFLIIIMNYKNMTKPFGIKFAMTHCIKGIKKKLHPDNYEFNKFKSNYKKYYR